MSRLVQILATALVLASTTITANAQGTRGFADIHVMDTTGSPINDATVTMSDPRTGLSRQKQSDKNGKVAMQLSPGTYALQIEKTEFETVVIERVSIQLGVTESLTFPMQDGSIEEIVTYGTAESFLHVVTGETGLNISLEEFTQIPVARSIESVALLASGTVPGIVAFGEDKTLVSFGGASVAENVYYIDGLNVSNFRNGLGGASVPFEFYREFDIKTGGYSPEYGRSTGGVLNATTRRGSNEFEFGVVAYYEPEKFRETSPNTILNDGTVWDLNSEDSSTETTMDLYVGGPIIRDRLFFFVLYEPQSTTSMYNGQDNAGRRLVTETADDFWGGNLTWNISGNHELSLTAFSDQREVVGKNYEYDVDARSRGDLTGTSTDFRGGDSFILNYQGDITDNLTVSAQYGSNEYELTTHSTNDVDCPLVVDVRDSSPSTFPGCWVSSSVGTDSDERQAYRFDVYFSVGQHQLRAGIDREDNTSFSALTWSGLSFAPDRVGGVYYRYATYDVGRLLPNGAIVPDANGDGSPVDTVRYRYLEEGGHFDTISEAWYIEDEWTISDKFTVSLGLRHEKFENRNSDGDTFIEIDDQWAPRLAVEWAPDGSGDQLLTLSYGRYHLPVAANTNVFLAGGSFDSRRYFLSDGSLDPLTGAPTALSEDGIPTTEELGSEVVTADGSVPDVRSLVDQTIEPMYQDEWILSYNRRLGDDWSAGVRYIYRDLVSTIEDVGTLSGLAAIGADPGVINFGQPCAYVLTNPGSNVTTFCDLNGDGELEETFFTAEQLGFPAAERTYEAIEVSARKDFNGVWSIQGSYTWSKSLGNTEGRVKSDVGQIAANLTTNFDIPEEMDGAYGYLPNDRRHKLKLWGSYQATERLMFGANLFLQSGRPKNAFGEQHPDEPIPYSDTFYLVQADGSLLYSPRGSQGRTDWSSQLNLNVIYTFAWGDSASVELRADVFNLLDADTVTEVGEHAEQNPDHFGFARQYQQPRYLRVGAAVRF